MQRHVLGDAEILVVERPHPGALYDARITAKPVGATVPVGVRIHKSRRVVIAVDERIEVPVQHLRGERGLSGHSVEPYTVVPPWNGGGAPKRNRDARLVPLHAAKLPTAHDGRKEVAVV